jgi:hypothetical protein
LLQAQAAEAGEHLAMMVMAVVELADIYLEQQIFQEHLMQ